MKTLSTFIDESIFKPVTKKVKVLDLIKWYTGDDSIHNMNDVSVEDNFFDVAYRKGKSLEPREVADLLDSHLDDKVKVTWEEGTQAHYKVAYGRGTIFMHFELDGFEFEMECMSVYPD